MTRAISKFILSIIITTQFLSADIGNNSVVYEGKAGDIPLRVFVQLPGVVPGLADISVRVFMDGVNKVTVGSQKHDKNTKSKVLPNDTAEPVQGEKNLFSTQLWLMDYGAYSINLKIYQDQRVERISIPVNSIATKVTTMNKLISSILWALLIILFFGGINLIRIGAENRPELSNLELSKTQIKRSYIVTAVALFLFSAVIYGGKNWLEKLDLAFQQSMFKYLENKVEILNNGKDDLIRVEIVDELWVQNRISDLIPDHGKIMHMYIVRDDFEQLAHVHPVRSDGRSMFTVKMPPLGNGIFHLYMDITHETGFSHTMTNTFKYDQEHTINKPSIIAPERDPDDSWVMNSDETRISWTGRQAVYNAENDISMRFKVSNNGKPVVLEPYISMGGHAAILKNDRSVFIHLHPIGTISMASKEIFEEEYNQGILDQEEICFYGFADDSTENYFSNNLSQNGEVNFPSIKLVKTGSYAIWVQVKSAGHVITQRFDFEVIL